MHRGRGHDAGQSHSDQRLCAVWHSVGAGAGGDLIHTFCPDTGASQLTFSHAKGLLFAPATVAVAGRRCLYANGCWSGRLAVPSHDARYADHAPGSRRRRSLSNCTARAVSHLDHPTHCIHAYRKHHGLGVDHSVFGGCLPAGAGLWSNDQPGPALICDRGGAGSGSIGG